jgi:hypothetical protein
VDIDQDSALDEVVTYGLQGMNHALGRHSS